jgi:hypothetical protein
VQHAALGLAPVSHARAVVDPAGAASSLGGRDVGRAATSRAPLTNFRHALRFRRRTIEAHRFRAISVDARP